MMLIFRAYTTWGNGIKKQANCRCGRRKKVGRTLSSTGWLASSLEDGTVPDAAYLVLTDESGKRSFVKGTPAARPDVAKAYNKPTLARAGYSIAIDTIGLQGAFVLQLAMKTAGHIEICPEYSISATLNDQVKQ